ncbi:hypothetical protein E0Z10_g8289 [Xylaria hypoxylon]|uniref:Uncharacterized protein n=1 Tax=Xylaria hypoxylon TaxID=37992 RepID=A0A4Z0Y9I8_9PEZI|nr:hypothetical protein E0Z10_g8289 [Xylaria hypoxylon]
MGIYAGWIYRQFTVKPKPLDKDVRLDGKTVIVIGANVGLGLKAAKEMAAYGLAWLILESPGIEVLVWPLDYESFPSLDEFGTRAAKLDRFDLVILNAGLKNLSAGPAKLEMDIVINTVTPGFCASSLHKANPQASKAVNLLAWTAAQGGHCLTDAVSLHGEHHGAYLSEQEGKPPSSFVLSHKGSEARSKIWNETIKVLEAEAPHVEVLATLNLL